ncbi:MAG: MerR family transcriptional regulator [Armatimonadetes bacterium]|nr:MerR family transcriptional regulator [Armatimonadota bacterium]
MPELEDYSNLGPFSPDELVDAVNTVLGQRGRTPIFTRRTLRYYVSEGLIPPPEGPPKYSRYIFEHLRLIVNAKRMQDQGMRLDEVRVRQSPSAERVFSEPSAPHFSSKPAFAGEPVRQYRLTRRTILTVSGDDQEAELRRSVEEIERLLRDST